MARKHIITALLVTLCAGQALVAMMRQVRFTIGKIRQPQPQRWVDEQAVQEAKQMLRRQGGRLGEGIRRLCVPVRAHRVAGHDPDGAMRMLGIAAAVH